MNRILIRKIADEVKNMMEGESSGHDWWHVQRVWKLAKRISKTEYRVDKHIVELSAILHDIADWKFHNCDETAGPKKAKEILDKYGVESKIVDKVCEIISNISFKGAGVKNEMKSLEGKIVQDADKLDALGAIGIGRTFAYGGFKNRPMHDPKIKPKFHKTKKQYFNSNSPTINHFYEKLLLLKNRMNTKEAKKIALKRHKFMENFLLQFYKEWDGKS